MSVADILDVAKLKAPSLYHHFGDKEGLFEAWAMDLMSRVAGALNDVSWEIPLADQLAEIGSIVTSRAAIDTIQLQRDIQRLQSRDRQKNLTKALESRLLVPIASRFGEDTDDGARLELARRFLHSVMICHPNYGNLNALNQQACARAVIEVATSFASRAA